MIYPDQFIPVLEKNGYVIDVDNFIWNKVCACIKMMEDKGIEPVPISVNVSRMHVYQEKFTENLKNMAGEYGIDPKYIPLEITESAFTKEEGSLF